MKLRHAILTSTMALALASPVQSAVILNDFTLNLSGVDGLAAGTQIDDISQITYTGIAHATNQDNNADGVGGPGEIGTTDGLLAATSFVNSGGGIIPMTGLNNDFELTFDFTVDSMVTSIDALTGVTTQTHLAPGDAGAVSDGLLHIYVDAFNGDGDVNSSKSTGLGYDDGVLIATFIVRAGDGGTFGTQTLDGSDDATFELVSALGGVWLDSMGDDLAAGTLLGITDSNFDGDSNNNGVLDQVVSGDPAAGFNDWADCQAGVGQTVINFCADEDGSAIFAQGVPEPHTIALLGLGLMGLGAVQKKKRA